MKSDYIDLVVTKDINGFIAVASLPAWSNAKPGDIVEVEGTMLISRDVLAANTVDKNDSEYRFAEAMNGGPIPRVNVWYRRQALDWGEEEEPEDATVTS